MTEITTLPSGLTVITETRRDVESVAMGVFVDAGTRDELASEHGLAHFLEHMAFKGTQARSAYQTVADIEAVGGDINAETSPETTSYTARMLASDWQVGLDVLFDIVTAPRFDATDIAVEQEVVVQEIAAAHDLADDRVVDGLGLAAFGPHAIGRPILGTNETVRALNADNLNAFCQRTYAPQSVIVSAAGNVDHQSIVDWMTHHAPLVPGTAAAKRIQPVFHQGSFFEARDTQDTHLTLAWEAPAFATEGSMTHAFVVQVLGGGMTSRLFQAIREELGLVYAIDAYQMIYSDSALGVIQTATSADLVPTLLAKLHDELEALADGVSDQELAIAKRQFKASLAMAGENLASVSARHARQWACLGGLRERAQLEAEIDAVTRGDVRQHWAHVLERGQFAKAAVGNAKALDLWADWSMVSASQRSAPNLIPSLSS